MSDKSKIETIKAIVIDWLDYFDICDEIDKEYTNGMMNSILAIITAKSNVGGDHKLNE